MAIGIRKNKFAFILIFFIGLLISTFGYFFLPARFFFDSDIILYDKFNEIGLIGSYPFTIWFYKVTGLKYLPFPVIGFIQFSIIIFLVSKIGIPENFHKINVKNTVIYLFIFVTAIFMSTPTKDFINFIYIIFIVFIFQRRKRSLKKTVVFGLLLLIFLGYFFRKYYLVIPVLMIGMWAGSYVNFKYKKVLTFVYGLVLAIGISLSYGLVKGVFISQERREILNQVRIGSENANSIISSPLDTSSWYGESFGIVYGFFSVNLPLNAFKYVFDPQILAFSIWQLFLFIVLILKYEKNLKEGRNNNYELWLFYFVFSYFIVQGIFEPDLGSAVRHKTGVFPLIYYLLNYETFRRKI